MKCLLFSLILFYNIASAQSPGLTIFITMDSSKLNSINYKIEMKICEPKKMTKRGDWFSHDTSKIDFASLKPNEIDCAEYFDKGTPTLISGKEEKPPFNQFEFSGQVFAWEKIFVFRISNRSSRGWLPEMYIVMPMKYKSFVTHINLTDIEFKEGRVIFLSDYNASPDERGVLIDLSLKDQQTVEEKKFSLREILENN